MLAAKSEMAQRKARYWQINKYKGDWGLLAFARWLPRLWSDIVISTSFRLTPKYAMTNI